MSFRITVSLVMLTVAAHAQSAAFDVASVKPNASDVNSGSISRSGGRITLRNISLRDAITFAYGIPTGRDYELSGPAWLDTENFDIVATCPADTSRDRVREMLRTLLAEGFSLRTHSENRKLESYALFVDKRGPKLQPDTTGAEEAFIFGPDHLTARATSIAGLADRLSGPTFGLDRPVIDLTGIKGIYDFKLNWAPMEGGEPGPSIFTALQEQLGLRLAARKIAQSILVVDHANKIPTGN